MSHKIKINNNKFGTKTNSPFHDDANAQFVYMNAAHIMNRFNKKDDIQRLR